jgi:hypothetical protein
MEEVPENGKESSHSVNANGMKERKKERMNELVSGCTFVYRPRIPQSNVRTLYIVNRVQIFDMVAGPSLFPGQSLSLGRDHFYACPPIATGESKKEFLRNLVWRGI